MNNMNNQFAHPEPFDSSFVLRFSKDEWRLRPDSVEGAVHGSTSSPRTVVAICTCSTYLCAFPYWGHVNPIGIRSCYDEGKRVAETLMMDYHRQNGVDTRIARLFNTFGPRMALYDGRRMSQFIVQAPPGQDLTLDGEGLLT